MAGRRSRGIIIGGEITPIGPIALFIVIVLFFGIIQPFRLRCVVNHDGRGILDLGCLHGVFGVFGVGRMACVSTVPRLIFIVLGSLRG